jgi:hypothetical protein
MLGRVESVVGRVVVGVVWNEEIAGCGSLRCDRAVGLSRVARN